MRLLARNSSKMVRKNKFIKNTDLKGKPINIAFMRCDNSFNNRDGYKSINDVAKKYGGEIYPKSGEGERIRAHYFLSCQKMVDYMTEILKEGMGDINRIRSGNIIKTKKGLGIKIDS